MHLDLRACLRFRVEKNYLDTLNTYEVHIPLCETD